MGSFVGRTISVPLGTDSGRSKRVLNGGDLPYDVVGFVDCNGIVVTRLCLATCDGGFVFAKIDFILLILPYDDAEGVSSLFFFAENKARALQDVFSC